MNKVSRLVAACLASLCLLSCASNAAVKSLQGTWADDKRELRFEHSLLTIRYINPGKVAAMRGPYSVGGEDIVFSVQSFSLDGTSWESIKGTQLEGHKEKFRFRLDGDTLYTEIAASGTHMTYKRVGQ